MILATLTNYNDISFILVPLTGLLLPGFAMAYFFLTIESKNVS